MESDELINKQENVVGKMDPTKTTNEAMEVTEEMKTEDMKTACTDIRVCVVGNVDSGKSTLIGVLTGGLLDNGRGLARSKIFTHRHEAESGRTSSASHHIMGFSDKHEPVYQNHSANSSAAQKTKSWTKIVQDSEKVMTFIDLAGHEKYLKTTVAGLTGCYPDYALVVVNSLAGVTKMTKEHLGVCIALKIPLCVAVTKTDLCPENVFQRTKKQLTRILRSPAAGKLLPLNVKEDKDLLTIQQHMGKSTRVVPIFYISCVNGNGMPLLLQYLADLKSRVWNNVKNEKQVCEFAIDQTFSVPGVGTVISGTVGSGTIFTNQDMLLGPMHDGVSEGQFKPVFIRSIHCKRMAVDYVTAGDSCAFSVRPCKRKEQIRREQIRPGMVLVDARVNPKAVRCFSAEVVVLHHPSTIKERYQAVIHCGIIRQTAAIVHIDQECLRTGDRSVVHFRFLSRPEYLHPGTNFIFREGSTKGLGTVRDLMNEDFTPLPRTTNSTKLHDIESGGIEEPKEAVKVDKPEQAAQADEGGDEGDDEGDEAERGSGTWQGDAPPSPAVRGVSGSDPNIAIPALEGVEEGNGVEDVVNGLTKGMEDINVN